LFKLESVVKLKVCQHVFDLYHNLKFNFLNDECKYTLSSEIVLFSL